MEIDFVATPEKSTAGRVVTALPSRADQAKQVLRQKNRSSSGHGILDTEKARVHPKI